MNLNEFFHKHRRIDDTVNCCCISWIRPADGYQVKFDFFPDAKKYQDYHYHIQQWQEHGYHYNDPDNVELLKITVTHEATNGEQEWVLLRIEDQVWGYYCSFDDLRHRVSWFHDSYLVQNVIFLVENAHEEIDGVVIEFD